MSQRQNTPNKKPPIDTRPIVEELEPRQLFSGGLEGVLFADPLAEPPVYLDINDGSGATSPAGTPAAETERHELVFIDTDVENYQELLNDILAQDDSERNIEVILLDNERDGIERISEVLAGYQDLDAIHLISHGNDGSVDIGNTRLDSESLTENLISISGWADSFSENGDFLIYGCNLAATEDGQSLIDALSNLTEADVAASDDLTGHESQGGDWDLEYNIGEVEASSIISSKVQLSWAGILDTTSGLVGHWTFDANANDASGNNYNGTLTNGAAIDTTDTTDQVGAAKLSLDGTNDYVNLDSHVSNFSSLTEGTISGWIKVPESGSGAVETIFSINDTNDTRSYVSFKISSAHTLKFEVQENDTFLLDVASTMTLNDSTWHHVAVTVNSSGNTLFIDGEVAGVTYNTGNSSTTSFFDDVSGLDSMAIGREENSSGGRRYFEGLLDDVHVHNRGLTASDIAELAQEAPVATNDSTTTGMDTTVNIDLTANDTDLDGETITVLDVGNPTNGTVVNNDDGTVTYTPDSNYTGTDSFTYLTADLDDTVSYWRLDGDATDAVGGNDGIITGTTTVTGAYGDALSFDGVDDKVVISDFDINNEFSMSFKFKVDDNSGSSFQYIYSHGDINLQNSLNIFLAEDLHANAGTLKTVIRDTNDTLDNNALNFDASSIIGDGQWHTYTLTVSAGQGAKVYLDGVLKNTDTSRGGDAFNPSTDLYFGARQDLDANRFFGGSLDSVQVFNRPLSAEAVSDVHTGGNSVATVNVLVNDPPANTVPGAQAVNEDTSLVFNSANSNLISISDGDAGSNPLRVTLTATNGLMTLSQTTGLTFSVGNGTADASMIFEGTLTNINAALDGLSFLGDQDFNGAANIQITTDDLTLTNLNEDSNLQGYYTFDNTGDLGNDDSTGGANDGSVNGAVTVNDATRGNVLSFDGTDDYVSLGDPVGLQITGQITLAAWVKPDSSSGNQDIMAKGFTTSPNQEIFLRINGGSYQIGSWDGTNHLASSAVPTGDIGNWVHIAGTYDGTSWNLYRNGVLMDSNVDATGAISVNEDWAIGANGTGTERFFDGLIDDARIYDRALAANEIANLGFEPTSKVTDNIAITVNAVNDVPVATGNTVIASEDVPLVIGPGDFNFTDVEGDSLASVTITGLNLNGGTLTHTGGTVSVTNGMTITAAQLADLTFTSALNDSTNSSFTYTVNDAGAGITSAVMNITVNAVNDVPVATSNTVIASEDAPLVIGPSDFNFTDVEGDSLASVTITGLNLNGGTLTHTGGTVNVTNGMTISAAQLADLTFTSALNDSTNSSFTYTVNDAGAGITSAVMNITVNAVNDLPVATGNTVIASEDIPLVIGPGEFNFTDIESDSLASVTITGLTLHGGTLTHTSGTVNVTNGMTITAAQLADLTFTSASNDSTNSSFTYTVNDTGAGVTSSVMNITVNAVNDVPVATGNTVIANEDVPLVIGSGAFNFTDVESDSLASVTITGLTLNGGTLTHTGGTVNVTNGMTITAAQLADLTFTSALNDSTNSSFTYTVNDAGTGITSSVMNITVNSVNDVPVATGNTVIASEDVPLVIGPGDFNFTDTEGDSLASVTITGLTLNGGTLTHTGGTVNVTNGMTITAAQLADLTFTSALNDSTNSSFTYTVNDTGAGVTSSVMNITVNAVNDVPVATGNTVIANEDVPLVIDSSDFNFTDTEGDSLASVTITGLNLNGGTLTHTGGTVSVTNGMTITAAQLADLTFTSALNDSTDSSFIYTVNDTGTGVASAVMNITVNAVNDVPVATGNTVIASEDVPLVINAAAFNFTDVEAESLVSVTITGLTLNGGTLTHTGGTVNVTNGMTVTAAQLADLTFTSASNDSTNSSFTYTVNDAGAGVTSAVMNITVNAVNDVPVATGNTVIANEDVPLVIGPGDFNFTDVEGDSLASVIITGLNLNGGTLTHTGGTVNVTNGMMITAAQLADLTFTSALNDSTNSSFTYTVNDAGTGITSSVMNITVNAVNDVPVATGNTVIASEDVPLVMGSGAFNFADVENDSLASVTITGLTLNGGTLTHTGGTVNVTNGMTITAAQLADLTFTSASNDSTNSSFTYTVNDAGTGVTSAVMNITVNAVNDVPVATGNTVVANEDVPLVIGPGDFNFTDVEGDSLASVTITGLNLNGGTLTHTGGTASVTNGMTITAAQLADLTFTSALNDSTNSSFTYTVNDAGAGITSAVMNITVNAVNDVPVATGDTVIASEDVPLVIGPSDFNFTDVEGDSLQSVTITGLTLNGGTLTHTGGTVNVTNGMTITAAQLADLTFTSALNDSTDSSFTYTVNDTGAGVTSSVMNITVNAVNDVPVATGNTVIANEDVPLVIGSGAFNFTDVESDSLASVTITGLTLNGGTLTHSGGTVNVTNGMTITAAQLADLTFTSASNDSTNSSFTYTVNDAGTGVTSAVMNITVNAINDVPVATGNTVIANEDVPLVINAAAFNFTDVEGDSLASVTITGLTLNGGTLTHTGGTVSVTNGMTITAAQLADLTFTSALNDSTDSSFTYTVNDTDVGVTSAVMNITVNASNDAPVANPDTTTTTAGTERHRFTVLSNDVDVDGDSVIVTGASAANGTVLINGDGSLSYTADPNFSGIDTITYDIGDGNGGVATTTVKVTVVPQQAGNPLVDTGIDPDTDPKVDPDEPLSVPTDPHVIDPAQPTVELESTESENVIVVKRALLDEILQSFELSDELLLPVVEKSKPGPEGRTVIKFSLKHFKLDEKFQAVQPEEVSLIPEDSDLWLLLDRMKAEMSLDLDEDQAAITVVAGTTVTFTAGFVSWILRGASLMASFLSSVPLFKQFDPLPILSYRSKNKHQEVTDGNSEDLQSKAVERMFQG